MIQRHRGLAAFVVVAVCVGLWIRVIGLGDAGISQAEAYIPGIPYPEWATNPSTRLDLVSVVRTTYRQDLHPPGYYVLMLGWTMLFGIGAIALRTSSVLANVSTLPLVAAAGLEESGVTIGTAVTLSTLNGQMILLSQQARVWVVLTLLATLATALLLRVRQRPTPALLVAYGSVLAGAMWIEYYAWFLVAAHLVWVLARDADESRPSVVLITQVCACIVALPEAALVLLQRGGENYLSMDVLDTLHRFVAFGFVLPLAGASGAIAWAGWLLAAVGVVLLVLGIRQGGRSPHREHVTAITPPWRQAVVGAPFLAALGASALTWWITAVALDLGPSRVRQLALVMIWGALAGWILVSRLWRTVVQPAWGRMPSRVRRALGGDLHTVQLLVPISLLVVITLFVPFLADRALMAFVPTLLLLEARGLASLLNTRGRRTVALTGVLGLGILSVRTWRDQERSPGGFRNVAAVLRARMRPGDGAVIRNAWWSQPLHYYLPADSIPTYPTLAAVPERTHPPRVWLVEHRAGAPSLDAVLNERLAEGRGLREFDRVVLRMDDGDQVAIVGLTWPP